MLKLYRKINGELHYWETWDNDRRTAVVHWGIVGDEGQSKEIKSGIFSSARKDIQKEINLKIKEGFSEFKEDDLRRLMIEYKIEGMGSEKDLDKRAKLEERMNELLGWRGLGHCDGGSIGSGTMEVCSFVVDFDIAKRIIEEDLKGTEFSDYTRIYEEK